MFATYALVNKDSKDPADSLTADKVFVALSLFNILRYPLIMLPMLVNFLIQVKQSESTCSSVQIFNYTTSTICISTCTGI